MNIAIDKIKISPFHRDVKPWLVEQITDSIKKNGYQVDRPIVIDKDNTLVEGRHRLESAKAAGLIEVPYEYLPSGEDPIRYGRICNQNGQLTAPDDVFDDAEQCWKLRQKYSREEVSNKMGWNNVAIVTYHTNIIDQVHPIVYKVTKNSGFVTGNNSALVTDDVTNVTLKESHFRAFLKHLPCPNGESANYREQYAAFKELLSGNKITAKLAEQVAEKYAWRLKLKQYMRDNIAKVVTIEDRKKIITQIDRGVYGKKPDDDVFARFQKNIEDLNSNAMAVTILHGDLFDCIGDIEDNSIDVLNTDPPYMVLGEDWDQFKNKEAFLDFTERWLKAVMPKVKRTGRAYISFAPDFQYELYKILQQNSFFGFTLGNIIIWVKRNNNKPFDRKRYRLTYEPIFYLFGPDAEKLSFSEDSYGEIQTDVWEIATPQTNYHEGKVHPAQKPLQLYKRIIESSTQPGDIVLDCFAGSGTTGLVCRDMQRKCILIEAEEKNISIIKKRLYGVGG